MPLSKIEKVLSDSLNALEERGSLKSRETVVTGVIPAKGNKGPRYLVEGYGDKEFLRMNSNSYLGITLKKEMIEAEEEAMESGALGASLSGAGPTIIAIVERKSANPYDVAKAMKNGFNSEGIECEGYVSRSTVGAHMIESYT